VESGSYIAAEFVTLGLVPVDSGMKFIAPWAYRHDEQSWAALPVLGAARDTLQLRKIVSTAKQVAGKDTSYMRRYAVDYFVAAAHAYDVLATGDSTAAGRLFDALPDTVFSYPIDQFVRARLLARTEPARALRLLERHRTSVDILATASQLERGRIAERLGERERAVDAYAFVTEAWKNTESPQLRVAVAEAATALKRLDGDGKMRAALIR
jgi:hypothetical protein